MSKPPRPKGAAPFSFHNGYELPATSQHEFAGLVGYAVHCRGLMTSGSLSSFLSSLAASGLAHSVRALRISRPGKRLAGGRRYMSRPRGQKAPRRFSEINGYQLPAADQPVRIWISVGAAALAMLIGQGVASSADAAPGSAMTRCGDDTRAAIAGARAAIEADNPADDHVALICLLEAVAALDDRIQGLADGSTPFEGQIYAPKGVAMTKPSDQEGR